MLKRWLLAGLITLAAVTAPLKALANPPLIWGDTGAQLLVNTLSFNRNIRIIAGTQNPQSSATDAPKGSLFLRYGASGGTFYVKQDDGSSTNWTAVSGTVSTTGGATTDNAIARWDGTTGLNIQNSSATLSDAGLLTTPDLILSSLTANTVPYLNGSKQMTSSSASNTDLTALVNRTASNTPSTIVLRDGSGNFSAGTITAALTGNVTGNLTGNVTGDLTGNVTGNVTGNLTGNVTGNVTGNADTATSLAANPSDCAADTYATTIAASGNLTCSTVSDAGLATSYLKADGTRALTGNWNVGAFDITAQTFIGPLTGNASTASALAANPSDCAADTYATTIAANGNLTCSTVSDSGLATSYLKADGSRALSANWNAGSFDITAQTFIGALTGNASTATALAANPSDCGSNTFAQSIAASGNLTCAAIDLGTADVTSVLPLTKGGTNKNMTAAAGALVYTDSDSQEVMTAGTAGQVATSQGSSAPTFEWGARPQVFGSRATPRDVVAGTGIVSGSSHMSTTALAQYVFIQGSGGAVTVSANPQISNGTIVGQTIILQGRSDTNTVTLSNGTGLSLNGSAVMGADDILSLIWDGTSWTEMSRSF